MRASDESSSTIEIMVPQRAPTWSVELQDSEGAQLVPLGDRVVSVGASRRADVVARDRTVSAIHAELTASESGVFVRDVGSRNGTFVGGARIREGLATAGTTITIGQTTLVCRPHASDSQEDHAEPLEGIAGASRPMRRVASVVRRLSSLAAPVLIGGETGVGKELVARALHREGARRAGPFVAVNVASLPRDLVESEMFGHERGAFTGAVSRRVGAFMEAEGGTLFLDEIGELPFDAQPKLLRALDGYEVRRVGAQGSGRRVSARVVAATHVPLEAHVQAGTFRRDLFHRLEVFVVELPPLRERAGDIAPIARALLDGLAREIGPRTLTSAALARLTAHDWPGNVRELRNVLYRAADLARDSRLLDAETVERAIRRPGATRMTMGPDIAQAWLARHDGNLSRAAREAGIPRTSFRKLLARSSDGA